MWIRTLTLCGALALAATADADADADPIRDVDQMLQLVVGDDAAKDAALDYIDRNWRPGLLPMALEAAYLLRPPGYAVKLFHLLERHTAQSHGFEINRWYQWLWNRPPAEHPHYAQFKSRLYRLIDERFADYFDDRRAAAVRLDEIRWGGVAQDGIPPLRYPTMIAAADADYLDDDHIVFGVVYNGDARAYPKRILAWHEMVVDTVGGIPIVGVYCTLCGTMIPFETVRDGVRYRFGTSGFLYRSNKLMYDQKTQSLWNTLWGTPVVGPLVGRGIELRRSYLVTTTWGEWRRRHPHTTTLSLDTGHRRDYGEGVAYRDYFATDELMFGVPALDTRLNNKDEVLALLSAEPQTPPLAISVDVLRDRPLYQDRLGAQRIVVLTDRSGASRVYQAGDLRFVDWDGDGRVGDAGGGVWTLSEDRLRSDDGRELSRLPAHRAFWFGWYAAYSNTRLVH